MGAFVAGADGRTLEALGRAGRALGLAYQISDDLLGIYGDDAKTGKPVGSDIHRRKRSFVTVCALELAGGAARERLEQTLAGAANDPGQMGGIIALLDAAGARAWAVRQVQMYCEQAMAALHGAPIPTWAHDGLREVAGFLAQREA
jgi:geranylgeranyl diphosphate synthase type I